MPPITPTLADAAPVARQSSTVYARRYVVADPRVRHPGVALATLLRGPAAPAVASSRPTMSAHKLREQIEQQQREAAARAEDRRDVGVFLAIALLATAVTFGEPIAALMR